MSDKTGSSIGKLQILPVSQERLDLQLHGLREKTPGTGAQHLRQRIVDVIGLTKADNVDRLFHRRIALSGEILAGLDTRLDTPPFSGHRHLKSRIAPLRQFRAEAASTWEVATAA